MIFILNRRKLCACAGSVGVASDNEIKCSAGGGVGWGGLWYVEGSTQTEDAIDQSCGRLRRLISAITAQLDWPDVLLRFCQCDDSLHEGSAPTASASAQPLYFRTPGLCLGSRQRLNLKVGKTDANPL